MMEKDIGRMADATGLSPSVEPASSLDGSATSIPCAVPLRVWWTPQLPMEPFEVDVPDLATADLLLNVLSDYDRFQFENHVKPDYCNAGGLVMFENGEWIDWWDDALCCDFDDWRDAYGLRASAMSAGTAKTPQAAEGDSPPARSSEAGDAQ